MYCQYCHTALQQGTETCPSCDEPVPPPHLLALTQGKPELLVPIDHHPIPLPVPEQHPQKNSYETPQISNQTDSLTYTNPGKTGQSACTFPQIPAPTIPHEDEQPHTRDTQIIESSTQKVSSLPGLLPDPVTPLPAARQPSLEPSLPGNTESVHTQKPHKNNKQQLLASIITLVAVSTLLIVALSAAYHKYTGNTADNAAKTISQPGAIGPSGNRVNLAASSILSDLKTTASINSDYTPTRIATIFGVDQTIYLTFHIASGTQSGFLQARWYQNSELVSTQQFTHETQNPKGYFSASYLQAGQGNVELYWCLQANCHDAELAQVVTFTVAGLSPTPTPPLTSSTTTANRETGKQATLPQ